MDSKQAGKGTENVEWRVIDTHPLFSQGKTEKDERVRHSPSIRSQLATALQ